MDRLQICRRGPPDVPGWPLSLFERRLRSAATSASRMTDYSAMSIWPRRRAVRANSVRPRGPVRGSLAIARIAARPSSVRAAVCLGESAVPRCLAGESAEHPGALLRCRRGSAERHRCGGSGSRRGPCAATRATALRRPARQGPFLGPRAWWLIVVQINRALAFKGLQILSYVVRDMRKRVAQRYCGRTIVVVTPLSSPGAGSCEESGE